ncbi:MAG: hypothetical protein NVSMB25_00960 [Thermoleophilaceae bacterium]
MRKAALVLLVLAALAMTAVAALATTPVTVGHSAWSWGNPQPQGETLRAIEFAGGRGYAAGSFGTVLRTDSGGLDWSGVATGISGDLYQIRAIDRNTVVIGSGCLLRRSDDGGQSFRRLPFGPSERRCPAGVTSFFFPTPATGYLLLGDGSVLRSDTGGQGFSRRVAVPGTAATGALNPASPTDVFFTSTETGIATVAGPAGGTIYRTTDGGGSWTLVATAPAGFNGLYFADSLTGYAVGNAKTLYRTADGGQTWTVRPVAGSIPAEDLTKIRCAPGGMTCLMTSKQGDRLLRTTNGGLTVDAALPASTQRIFAAAFNSTTNVAGVGETGATVISGDSGSTFTAVGMRLSNKFSRLRFTSPLVAEAPGDRGSVARTADGGQTWSTVGVATSSDVRDVAFPDVRTGFALDATGTVSKTADGGATWSLLNTRGARPRAIYSPDTSTLLLVGARGVSRSTDAGSTFASVPGGDLRAAGLDDFARAAASARTVVAYGRKALFISADGGAHFRALPRPDQPRGSISRVSFVNASLGYVLDRDGRLFVTRNGGRRWSELGATGTDSAYDLTFGDGRNGYLSVAGFGGSPGGYVLRTSDGGRTWRPQLVASGRLAAGGIVAAAPRNAFALSMPGKLFYTTSGGDGGVASTLRLRAIAKRGTKGRRRTSTLTIRGRLSPAVASADVSVSIRDASGGGWRVIQAPPLGSDGSFALTGVRLRRTSYVVAQWAGDGAHDGSGSSLITVRP